ncbi:unnamed protein product [Effrenium voratum]|nr:unnamed protein product [Effrenium voratum]
MGFAPGGDQVLIERMATTTANSRNTTWQQVVSQSERLVTFSDLCGHEKYLKTTIFGLVGQCPDYTMIIVNANAGFQRMSREHLGIALALSIPFFIVVTKIDIAPQNVYEENLAQLHKIVKSNAVKRQPLVVKEEAQMQAAASGIYNKEVCPIFCVSNVTGDGLPLLRCFLRCLPSRLQDSGLFKPPSCLGAELLLEGDLSRGPAEFHIDSIYVVPGVGLVVGGVVRAGRIRPGQQLLLGPDKVSQFKPVLIKTIQYKRVNVDSAESGQQQPHISRAFAVSLRLLLHVLCHLLAEGRDRSCLCLEVCCCPGLAMTGNRFMVQTRFDKENTPCDDCIMNCTCLFLCMTSRMMKALPPSQKAMMSSMNHCDGGPDAILLGDPQPQHIHPWAVSTWGHPWAVAPAALANFCLALLSAFGGRFASRAAMVIKTDLCNYTEQLGKHPYRIYPGHGQKFIAKDAKVSFFITAKADSLYHQRIKPVKLRWTQAWRRMNKKGKVEEGAKKRTRKAQKFQKAIVGMSLDDIKKKKAMRPELRNQREQAAKEAKAKQAAQKKPGKPAVPKTKPDKSQKLPKGGGAPSGAKNFKGKK